jgi:cytochrome bd ubiquinol oxidase subunit II
VIAGTCTFALVLRRRYEPARYSAAVAVGAVVAGWALAQSPTILPGLTIKEAAAAHDTLVAIIVSVLAGGAILFPSLALLFKLVLGGRLDEHEPPRALSARDLVAVSAPRVLTRVAGACLIAGLGFMTVADAGWAHAIGATCLLAFVAFAFPAALPPEILESKSQDTSG